LLDKSQFATGTAHGANVGVPVMSDAQFAALAMGAHPYRVCQLHWHSTDYKPLLEKMNIDHAHAWAEFQEDLAKLKAGEKQYLSWEDVDA
jgi:heterodisulfide reductase subunit B